MTIQKQLAVRCADQTVERRAAGEADDAHIRAIYGRTR